MGILFSPFQYNSKVNWNKSGHLVFIVKKVATLIMLQHWTLFLFSLKSTVVIILNLFCKPFCRVSSHSSNFYSAFSPFSFFRVRLVQRWEDNAWLAIVWIFLAIVWIVVFVADLCFNEFWLSLRLLSYIRFVILCSFIKWWTTSLTH